MNKITRNSLLQNMAIFVDVATLGSFSHAAKMLQMTPSSVSKRMTQLEEQLGAKLIERTTRSMRLTSTGEAFLKHCQNMLTEANIAVEMASLSQQALAGDISLSVPKAFAHHVLNPILPTFFMAYPKINLHIVVSDDTLDLLRDNIDCAIEISNLPPDYLIARPLVSVRQVLCATPRYLSANPKPIYHPTDLQHHDCITLGETATDNNWRFIKATDNHPFDGLKSKSQDSTFKDSTFKDSTFKDRTHSNSEKANILVTGRYAVNHTRMRLDGVLNHLGIACLPDFVARQALLKGDVVEILPEWRLQSKYQGTAWLTYLPNKFQTLRIRALIDFLQDTL